MMAGAKMKVNLEINSNAFDAIVRLRDSNGVREYMLSNQNGFSQGQYETNDNSFNITVLPICSDFNDVLDEIDRSTIKGKISSSILNKMVKFYDDLTFRIGCQFVVTDYNNSDEINITVLDQLYNFKNSITGFLGYEDVAYCFGDIVVSNGKVQFVSAKGLNTDAYKRHYKKLLRSIFEIDALVTYPISSVAVNYYTSNKTVYKKLKCLYEKTPEEREAFLNKQIGF